MTKSRKGVFKLSEAAQFEVWIAEGRPPLPAETQFYFGADDRQFFLLCRLENEHVPKKGTVSKGNLPTIDF